MSMSMIHVCDAILFIYLCIYVDVFYISYNYNYKLCTILAIIASNNLKLLQFTIIITILQLKIQLQLL